MLLSVYYFHLIQLKFQRFSQTTKTMKLSWINDLNRKNCWLCPEFLSPTFSLFCNNSMRRQRFEELRKNIEKITFLYPWIIRNWLDWRILQHIISCLFYVEIILLFVCFLSMRVYKLYLVRERIDFSRFYLYRICVYTWVYKPLACWWID